MRFTAVLLFVTTAWGGQHHHQRDTTDDGINLGAITSALEHMMGNKTASANFANISPPPRSLIPEILSVVPVSVIWELINPAERSSLASQFKAGTTPAWYNALPLDVKDYMSVVKSQISAGALTATASETNPTANSGAAATAATATDANSGSASSTSSKGTAAQPTGLTVSALGALGVLGLALAL
ncbi:hypothetical protein N7472_001508 [Penicillium cf. griseofulvum]|uniref:Uncharacterized protein n=1 Tax=Penicillium cf. griseofulvum TaxID=2972120 RepID=A0A9W9T6Q4_9EURO|nr:hypothetical protein N7472_001508 [Penicillium cf. griseofulvum]KAJ5428920.1 hypothetical protein N7445_010374 [Penicillium cf. griseofulvum]